MSVSKIKATVFSQEQLASDVFSMWLEVGNMASEAKPGQFISVYSNDDSKLLPRPISICEIDKENGRLRIVYRVVGYGTKEFSGCRVGDTLEIMGPLGNGYTLKKNKAILVVPRFIGRSEMSRCSGFPVSLSTILIPKGDSELR